MITIYDDKRWEGLDVITDRKIDKQIDRRNERESES